MNPIQTARVGASFALVAAAFVATGTAPATAASDSQGCASGQTTYQTSFLIAHGFSPDFLGPIDENGDGIVCGKPLSPQQQQKFCAQFPTGCQQPVILAVSDNTRGRGY
jgi:hypothetical protein